MHQHLQQQQHTPPQHDPAVIYEIKQEIHHSDHGRLTDYSRSEEGESSEAPHDRVSVVDHQRFATIEHHSQHPPPQLQAEEIDEHQQTSNWTTLTPPPPPPPAPPTQSTAI